VSFYFGFKILRYLFEIKYHEQLVLDDSFEDSDFEIFGREEEWLIISKVKTARLCNLAVSNLTIDFKDS